MSGMPYIGVRGWTHAEQTKYVALAFEDLGHEPTRALGIIVNVDDVTLIEGERRARERCGEGNVHARLRPPAGDIVGSEWRPGIFVNHPLVLNFVSLDAHEMFIWGRMEDVVERYGPLLHGIKLGAMWPSVWAVREFRERYPSLRVVLRITRDAVRAVGPVGDAATPIKVAARVAEYDATDALVNLSGPPEEGGTLFDAKLIGRYLRAIHIAAPEAGLVVAGGFGAKEWSLRPLEPLLPEFPQLSINAGAALVSVVNCVDASCAVGLYRRAERRFAENEEAVAANEQFKAAVERLKPLRHSYS